MNDPSHVLLRTPRFRVEMATHTLTDGRVHQREVVRHPGAVTILPLLPHDRVCLIRNYRLAVERSLIELPAGTLEPDEDPGETAGRELIEETGYRAGVLERLHTFFLSPGILDEQMHLFLATDLVAGEACREPGEEIENLVVSWDEAMQLVQHRRIEDAKTLTGLMFYDMIRRHTRR